MSPCWPLIVIPVIGLVLVDVDGTLYGSEGVPDCAWEAAERARSAGLHLGVCTGRPGRGRTLEYAQRLDPEGLHIFESGAVVIGGDGTVRRAEALDAKALDNLINIGRAHQLGMEIYTAQGGFYIEAETEDILRHEAMLGLKAERRGFRFLPGTPVRLQYVVREGKAWEQARREIQALGSVELHEATSPGTPGVIYASVTAWRVSKRTAAKWVAAQYGLDLHHLAMVGDGDNDLELIRAAALGIAMGNAPAEVQKAAAWVVPSVDECGLAEALDRIIIERQT